MDHRNREKLVDVPERRALAEALECREQTDGSLILTGYAATWDPYDCYGGPDNGGWIEELSRSSLQRTLSEQPDVMLLINHEGLPIARTKSGNLDLSTDSHGLLVRAELDPSDPDVQRIAPKMKARGSHRPLLDEMSFSFRVKSNQWNSDYSHRTINEISLQKGDVSVVNYGMNPGTRAAMITDTVAALARAGDKELVEIRRADRTTLAGAMQVLQRAWRANEEEEKKPPPEKADERSGGFSGKTFVNPDGGHLLYEGQCITCGDDRAKKPYGNVDYADPGYLDSGGKQAKDGNGVARYPIDAGHVQAAWSYINQPKNQKGYTAEQVSAIKSKIKAAMKKHGHEVSEDQKAMRDNVCPGGSQCPGESCPVHGQQRVMEISHVEAVRKFGGGTTLVAVMNDGTRTPLPSFRQSGEFTSSPAGTDVYGRARTTDNSMSKVPGVPSNVVVPGGGGGGGGGSAFTSDPSSYTKDDLGSKDPGELHGKPAPAAGDMRANDDGDEDERATSTRPGGKLGGDDDGDEDDDEKRGDDNPDDDEANPGDKPDDEEPDDDDKRGVTERLRELRRETGELPETLTVSAMLDYMHQLA